MPLFKMTIELEHGKGAFYYYYASFGLFEKRGNILPCSNSIVILFNWTGNPWVGGEDD